MPDTCQLPKYRYRLERRMFEWDSWREYGNYENSSDAFFAKEEAFMQDHLDDCHNFYRIVEFRVIYEED